MIRKLLLSLMIITGVSASAFVATQALLADTATLAANTFSTGSVDLQINSNGDSLYSDSEPGFTDTLFPGQAKAKFFKLKNNGSGTTLSIAAQSANISGIPADKVIVSFTPWTSSTTAGNPESGSVKTTHTLAEWLATPADLGTPNLASNGVQDYRMDVMIDPSVSAASSSTTFDFVFTGTHVNVTPTVTPTP